MFSAWVLGVYKTKMYFLGMMNLGLLSNALYACK